MMISGKNFLGHSQSALGEIKFSSFNPVSNEHNPWEFTEATPEEIDAAAHKAARVFTEFRDTQPGKRAAFLRAIGDEILDLGEELIETYVLETGLAPGRAQGERGRTIGQLNMFADLIEEGSYVNAVIETAEPDRSPSPKPDIRTMNVPLGPIVVFGSSNFPLAFSTAGGDTASALAAGCPVIVKCHPFHAATSELVASAILKAGSKTNMPDGIFSHLFSKDHRVGTTLVSHPEIKGVGFTGSIQGGLALNKIVQQREEPIPFFGEMGSVNPVVILPNALKNDAKTWAAELASSIIMGAGQFCTNPGLILGVKSPELDTFIGDLGKALLELDNQCMLHPAIHDQYQLKHYAFKNEDSVAMVSETTTDKANFAKHSLFKVHADTFIKNEKLRQEVFGPLSLVVECENSAQLKQVIKSLEGQLTGTVIGQSSELRKYEDVTVALMEKVGRVIFNGVPTGVEVNSAMHHGGPFPASTDSRFTSVGSRAIQRWIRPLCYQNWPDDLLPDALKNLNPLGILRQVDKHYSKDPIPPK